MTKTERPKKQKRRAPAKTGKSAPPEVKRPEDEPISLHPLTVEEALAAALKVPWPPPKT